MFDLPRSSWDDYNRELLSKGGGIFPRTNMPSILAPMILRFARTDGEVAGPNVADQCDPEELGRSALVRRHRDVHQGLDAEPRRTWVTPSNDALRVSADELLAKVIGEGANLAITQAGRIEFAERGGHINTDFIDNSAGVDCSDNEVNIKIPLNREMQEKRLTFEKRNALLERMTDDVADLVLEDNRLQTLARRSPKQGSCAVLRGEIRTIELLENAGRLDRKVEGLAPSAELIRRLQENRGLTRPELAVVLSISKLVLQDAAEELHLADDPLLEPELFMLSRKPCARPMRIDPSASPAA